MLVGLRALRAGVVSVERLVLDVSPHQDLLGVPWQASAALVLEHYGLDEGVLVVDDSDQRHAKRTKRIALSS